jgi:NAD(P)-dependent dehydrogenase (short-subunit alcohol dehydrogenase family)
MFVVVTGGSSGIGKAIVELAQIKGFDVINFDKLEGKDVTKPVKLNIVPDILINCAGITEEGNIYDKGIIQRTKKIMDVNLYGAMNMIKWFIKKTYTGSIVNICSKSAYKPMPNRLAYAVSKGALVSLTKQLAIDLAPTIRVNSVSPGIINTSMPNSSVGRLHKANNLLKRKGTVEEVASLVLEVAENPYITGQDFIIDGGALLI